MWAHICFVVAVIFALIKSYLFGRKTSPLVKDDFKVIIVGGGFSGLAMAIKLKNGKIPFILIEKGSDIGGTWYWNKYWGCACDIPSMLYSLTDEPNPKWSRVYPTQTEIYEYLREVAAKNDLYKHFKLNTEVDTAVWDAQAKEWVVTNKDKSVYRARVLISGFGALHNPCYPDIPGRDEFKGLYFHTADWSEKFDPKKHKKIAVVGSAASAIQCIPELAKHADKLYVFQRTPNWITPRQDGEVSEWRKRLHKSFPFTMKLWRWFYYWRQELMFYCGFTPSRWTAKYFKRLLVRYIEICVGDKKVGHGDERRLSEALTPRYPPGCKRILISSDFYKTLTHENVHLITHPIDSITQTSIVAKTLPDPQGNVQTYHFDCDAIVFATGFNIMIGFPRITSKSGVDLVTEAWKDEPTAYLGIATKDFPNMFILLGPHTGLGHNSVVWMIECQVNYIYDCICQMIEEDIKVVEVKPEIEQQFVKSIDKEMEDRVWHRRNCVSWYQTKKGRVFALWPNGTPSYWLATRPAPLRSHFNVSK